MATKPMLGMLRVSQRAQEILRDASQASDLGTVLRAISGLASVSLHDRYDGGGWCPYDRGGKLVWLASSHNSPSVQKDDPLYKLLEAEFPPGTIAAVSTTDQDAVVIEHVPTSYETGGEIGAHLRFKKASKY